MVGNELAKSVGWLSNEFVHVGPGHRGWLHVGALLAAEDVQHLRHMLLPIKVLLHVVDLVSEVVCIDVVDTPKYWGFTAPNRYEYRISEASETWMQRFFGNDLGKATEP